MTDDPGKKGKQDRSRINTSQNYEVRYWSKKFGVSPEKLKAAVKKSATRRAAVQKNWESRGRSFHLLALKMRPTTSPSVSTSK
jgi:hypothetical protein